MSKQFKLNQLDKQTHELIDFFMLKAETYKEAQYELDWLFEGDSLDLDKYIYELEVCDAKN